MVRAIFFVILLNLLTIMSGCGGGNSPVAGPEPSTAADFVAAGWEQFEAGNAGGALSDFTSAVGKDPGYGPAYAGRGWAYLWQAGTMADFQTAQTDFDQAIDLGLNQAYVLAGRAAVELALSGEHLVSAANDAQAALALDPQFVFAHGTGFDGADLNLITAFAKGGSGDLAAALEAADQVVGSGIEAGDFNTWVVDGAHFSSFSEAVLAQLQKLSDSYAGF